MIEANAHLVAVEMAGVAALSGVQIRPVLADDGVLTAAMLRAAMRPDSPHAPRPSAITVENTHSASGGRVMSLAGLQEIAALAGERRLPLHLDGARLWNAACALDLPPARIAAPATTVMVSMSKALGCPVGSCLAFPKAARRDAWEIRRRLGGGMRQSGILAAAGLYALDHNLQRIGDDHAVARRLAAGLEGHPHLRPLAPRATWC